jgi:hypothetical protein
MSAADWAILIPAVVAFLTAGATYLKSRSHDKTITAHTRQIEQLVKDTRKNGN